MVTSFASGAHSAANGSSACATTSTTPFSVSSATIPYGVSGLAAWVAIRRPAGSAARVATQYVYGA